MIRNEVRMNKKEVRDKIRERGIFEKECGQVGLFLYHVGLGAWDLSRKRC